MPPPPPRLLFLHAAALAAGLTGCTLRQELPPWPEASVDPATPALLGASNGLELRVWAVQGREDDLLSLIDEHRARPTAMPDSVRQAWRASGLAVLEVPIADLAAVRARLDPLGPEQREWFGQSPGWSELARGRALEAGAVVRMADGLMQTPAGRLRLLSRCWTVPGESPPQPALHMEIAVQLERRQNTPSPFQMPAMRDELEAGVLLPGLSAAMLLQPGLGLLIIPVPGAAAGAAEGVRAPEPEPGRDEPAHGPPAPLLPTLGEAMLSSATPGGIEPVGRRAVLVLLPRLPDRFEVLR
jgi:hypothetical protein